MIVDFVNPIMNSFAAVENRPVLSLDWRNKEFYLWSAVFILGNLALPQLCHLAALGGKIWLPVYFCTLIAASRFGWKVATLTAILSPLLNYAFFAMPPAAVLHIVLVKSLLIAVLAPLTAKRFGSGSLLALALAIVGYQLFGALYETLTVSFNAALDDFRLGWPGLLVQLFGGWLVLKLWQPRN